MRSILALAGVVLAACPALAQGPSLPSPCRFTVSGTQAAPHVTGPEDLVARLVVTPQPDSPIEITAIDLTKMAVSIGPSSYREDRGSEYVVWFRNRSDQPVYRVSGMVGFRIGTALGSWGGGSGTGVGWDWKGTLAPGETARTVIKSGGGSGSNRDGEVTLAADIGVVAFADCGYVPSRSYWSFAGK